MNRPRLPSSSSPPLSTRTNTREKAVEGLVRDLQLAASCITKDVLVPIVAPKDDTVAISFGGRSARARVGTGGWAAVDMRVKPARISRNLWHVHTVYYAFSVFPDERERRELLCYHFHPESSTSGPHLHVNAEATWRSDLRRSHLATSRVTVEQFVEFLIRELGVRPKRSDWSEILTENLARFEERRTWDRYLLQRQKELTGRQLDGSGPHPTGRPPQPDGAKTRRRPGSSRR